MIRNKPYQSKEGPLVALVTTPIGNMEDITLRAIHYLSDADVIAAEDTRNTGLLLSHLGIKPKKLVSLYAQTEAKDAVKLVQDCKKNNWKVAYCSDAGMPGISDPGALLVKCCYENDVPVTILPGPTASLSALVLSGLDSADFSFYGFLPTKEGQIKSFLTPLVKRKETLIFYESPKRVSKTLSIMAKVFGEDREVTLVRELTKLYEESIKGTLKELSQEIEEVKGECVIIVKGCSDQEEVDVEQIKKLLRKGLKEGKSASSLSKEIASELNLSKNLVYKIALELK